ncbi:MAG: serine hydrolase [Thermomicrobiales bacterium]
MTEFPARLASRRSLLVASGLGAVALAGCTTSKTSTPTPTTAPTATVAEHIPTAPDRPRPVTSPVATPHIQPPPASPIASPVATPTSHSPAQPVTEIPKTHEQELSYDLVAGEVGIYGVVVLESDGSVVVSINGTTPFITASTYKVVVIADILHRVEQGEYALDDYFELTDYNLGGGGDNYWSHEQVGSSFPLEEYLVGVAVYSSNASAHTLLDLTSVESLNKTARAIGMDRTVLFATKEDLPWWPPEPAIDATQEEMDAAIAYLENEFSLGPVNISTPLDMARYNLAIVHDTLLSPWVSAQVADLLMANAIRDRIPALLDGDVLTLDKPGNLEDAVNDVGVIFLPSGPRPLALMAMGVPDEDWTTWIEQRLAVIAAGYGEYPPMPGYDELPVSGDGDPQWENDEDPPVPSGGGG